MSLNFATLINPVNLVNRDLKHFYLSNDCFKYLHNNSINEFATFIGFAMAAYINGSVITSGGQKIINQANSTNGFAVPIIHCELSTYTVVLFTYLCYQASKAGTAKVNPDIKYLSKKLKLSKTKVVEALAELLIQKLLHLEIQSNQKTYYIKELLDLYPPQD